MLTELAVENLLLIERARLRMCGALNVITGETGAGKTILAHALDLLLGGRARPGIVRPGAHEAYVEGIFELEDDLCGADGLLARLSGPPDDAHARQHAANAGAEVVLARRVGADGRTRAYVNGRAATVSDLRDLGAQLIRFYGQHEHRKLTLTSAQLGLLDDTCGPEHALRLQACAEAFATVRRLEGRLAQLRGLSRDRERELDLLEHELGEIESAALDEHEHAKLLGARERVRRRDALCLAADSGSQALTPDCTEAPGAAQLMASAAAQLDAVAGVDPSLDALAQRMRALVIEARDLAGELRAYAEALRGDGPASEGGLSLEALEERLAIVERLTRKHGGGIRSVLDYAERARARRDELDGAEVALAQTDERLARAQATLGEQARLLADARRSAAARLVPAVRAQLASLGMGGASFDVRLTQREVGPSGAGAIEFMVAPNPGVPAGPLREIASGGELSRVMLAIMSVANAASETTIVFDEVDAGIGGHTARAVGTKLQELARARQVVCITHLPQIASLGERHFSIVKDTSATPTRATVDQLRDGEVVAELVRMLGADASDTGARRLARELRRAA